MTGESGTGKSLLARAIHHRSPRRDKPFIEVSCGALPETLLESELFGHVKGAFTGAIADKPGRFLSADGGTLFLDEINSASPAMQVKLLRVLQERAFEPVGSSQTKHVDVRVILASNVDLTELVAAQKFRQDLYYRINVVTIRLPALRERLGDIPLLAGNFLRQFCQGERPRNSRIQRRSDGRPATLQLARQCARTGECDRARRGPLPPAADRHRRSSRTTRSDALKPSRISSAIACVRNP